MLRDLLSLACSYSGETGKARELVLSLPHEWLLNNIEASAESLLQYESYEEYWGLLQIYTELDKELGLKLAHRAASHPNEDIRDAGEHYLEILQ